MTRFQDMATVAGPSNELPPFTFEAAARVAFSDTDAQGIVYYGRYAPYFDVARVEYFRYLNLGHSHEDASPGEFVMRHFEIEYHAPAVFDDVLAVFCRVAKIGNSSLTFEYAVTRPDVKTTLATSKQTMVYIDLAARKSLRIPDHVRDVISKFEPSLNS